MQLPTEITITGSNAIQEIDTYLLSRGWLYDEQWGGYKKKSMRGFSMSAALTEQIMRETR